MERGICHNQASLCDVGQHAGCQSRCAPGKMLPGCRFCTRRRKVAEWQQQRGRIIACVTKVPQRCDDMSCTSIQKGQLYSPIGRFCFVSSVTLPSGYGEEEGLNVILRETGKQQATRRQHWGKLIWRGGTLLVAVLQEERLSYRFPLWDVRIEQHPLSTRGAHPDRHDKERKKKDTKLEGKYEVALYLLVSVEE